MRYNERMRIDGQPIEDDVLARLTTRIAEQVMQMEETGEGFPTVFEIGTALMFTWFAEQNGLGCDRGRAWRTVGSHQYIGADGLRHHAHRSGSHPCARRYGRKNRGGKGGIIKDGVPVVLQSQGESVREVIRRICEEKHRAAAGLCGLSAAERATVGTWRGLYRWHCRICAPESTKSPCAVRIRWITP